jgi:hypothetical protein
MPIAVTFERLDRTHIKGGYLDACLFLQDAMGSLLGMLAVVEVVVREEPALFAVVARGVLVASEQDLLIGDEANICDQLMNLATSCLHRWLPHRNGTSRRRPTASR